MPGAKTFGRRIAAAQDPLSLSPAAEAFCDQLTASGPGDEASFSAFRRARRARWIGVWVVRLLLCAPGLVCFLVGAPPWLSAALELAGMASGAWIRQERRRQLKEIASWEPEG
jgi:hypothetical protein